MLVEACITYRCSVVGFLQTGEYVVEYAQYGGRTNEMQSLFGDTGVTARQSTETFHLHQPPEPSSG